MEHTELIAYYLREKEEDLTAFVAREPLSREVRLHIDNAIHSLDQAVDMLKNARISAPVAHAEEN